MTNFCFPNGTIYSTKNNFYSYQFFLIILKTQNVTKKIQTSRSNSFITTIVCTRNNFIRYVCCSCVNYQVGQNVHLFFSIRWLQQSLVVFNFIQNNFVRLYCDSCHISVNFKKMYQHWRIFVQSFNVENGRKYATCPAYCALLFQER